MRNADCGNAEFLKGLNAEGAVRKIVVELGVKCGMRKLVFIIIFFIFFICMLFFAVFIEMFKWFIHYNKLYL